MTGWELTEDTLVPPLLPWKESLFTISNGYLGTRGTFEEGITGRRGRPSSTVCSSPLRVSCHFSGPSPTGHG